MNREENINKIKESLKRMFSKTEESVIVEQKFEDVILADGVKASVDKLEKDGIITMEDGSFPTPGELTLEDGRIIVVAENGLITEVKEAEVKDETPVEEAKVENAEEVPTEIETPEEESTENEVVSKLEERVKKLEELIAELMGASQEMKKAVAEFAAQPADEAAVVERKFAKTDKSEITNEILKLRARNKNK